MRGAGDTVRPDVDFAGNRPSLSGVPVAYLLAFLTRNEARPNGEPYALFLSMLISWVMGAVITVIVFRRGKWKNKAIIH